MRVIFSLLLICSLSGCTQDQGKNDNAEKKPDIYDKNTTKTDVKSNGDAKKPSAGPDDTATAKTLLVGKWEGTDVKGRSCAVEFTPFGTVRAVKPDHGSGKYLISADNMLDCEFSSGNNTQTYRCKITVSRDELVVTDKQDRSMGEQIIVSATYKRVEVFSAAVKSPQELIIGKWKTDQVKGMIYDFSRDGSHVRTYISSGNTIKGHYTFKDPSTVEFRLELGLPPETWVVLVTPDQLEIRGLYSSLIFTKVKE